MVGIIMKFKKIARILTVLMIVFFMPAVLFSDDIKDADRHYKELNYKYALEIYEAIMKTSPNVEVAQKIANCYRFINDTESSEIWYKKVLTYPNATTDNLRYLAESLKQNGKFEEAAVNFLAWGTQMPAKAEEAEKEANICGVAKIWAENPDIGALVENEIAFNSENSDFSPSRFGDDILLISDRWQKNKKGEQVYGWTGNPYLKIYSASIAGKQVDILKGSINQGFHSGPLAVNASLDTIIFTRAVKSANKKFTAGDVGKQYLLIATKKDNEWAVRDQLLFNESGLFSVQHPALSPNGNILYYASDMPGGHGGMDLYFSEKLAGGIWSQPINCGSQINTPQDDVFPTVREDGKFYFSSKGHIGMGGLDIFSAIGSKDSFHTIENLRAPINSPKDDFGIAFNKVLTTEFLSSNRVGGQGLDDVFSFKTGIKAEPKAQEKIYVVSGLVIEKGTNIPISGLEVVLVNKNTGRETKTHSDEHGKFAFSLERETDYVVKGNREKYFNSQSGEITTKGVKESTIFDIKFELQRAKEAYTMTLNSIFYDFNKWNIRADALADLDKVDNFMSRMPNLKMELVAHTDARGTAAYNLTLSEKRANSAKQYLLGKGVASERLSTFGKGETELVNQCEDGVKCTAAQHQLNRRTEFKIVKVEPVLAINVVKKKTAN